MKGTLYTKTEYSMLESANKLALYLEKAKSSKASFLALTDTNLSGSYKFYKACVASSIKPIMGLEYSFINADQLSSTVLIYALNNDGYKELMKISTLINTQKINLLDDVLAYKNLAFVHVFNDSYLERLINKDEELFKAYIELINSKNTYIGISYTNKLNKIEENRLMEEKAKELNVKILPIHKCLYLEYEDSNVYEILTKIASKDKTIEDFEDYCFRLIDDERVDEFVNKINLDLYKEKINLPKFPNTKGYSSKEYLEALCYKGLEKRKKTQKSYYERLDYELSVINKMGYDDYFLIVWDFIKYAKNANILVGPGRGSAAGSLVAYTLGITDVDPLEFGLLFERFLNPERVSMPDIDTDFPDQERENVINYVKSVYGKDHICNISAFDTFQYNIALKDVAKVLDIDDARVKIISDMISKYSFDELLTYYHDNDEILNYLNIVRKIKDMPRHTTTHAAGIILSDRRLVDIIPLQEGINGLYQAQLVAPDLEEIGLLKMDFLGISNLTMIEGVLKEINMPQKFIRNVPLNDPKVYKMLQEADTLGIFQLESFGMRNYLRKLKCERFDDIVAMIALYRPGPMENIPDYIKRRHGEKFEYIHKDLEPILSSTYGIIVYQEQIMQIAQKFAGFSLGEADLLRRAISKKKVEALAKMEEDFINKSINNGYTKDIAKKIYDLIYKFADYGFNKSHSVVYSLVAFQMAYLKVNYTSYFMKNLLNMNKNSEKIKEYLDESKLLGIEFEPISINQSCYDFVISNNKIILPLSLIKSIAFNVCEEIINERNKSKFKSFYDFMIRCYGKSVNKKVVIALLECGAFNEFNINKKQLVQNIDEVLNYVSLCKDLNIVVEEEPVFDSISDYSDKESIDNEIKNYGFYISYHPVTKYNRENLVTIDRIKDYFDKTITTVLYVESIKTIKTKTNEKMSFVSLSDEHGLIEGIIFPREYKNLSNIEKNNVYKIYGKVERKNNDFQIIIYNMISLEKRG